MAVYVRGDTHGIKLELLNDTTLQTLTKKDYLIVCGDFGYVFLNSKNEKQFLGSLEKRPYTILFCDGNHENFELLNSYPVEDWHGGKIHRIRKNVIHLMRGQVYDIDGKKYFAFGGAYSKDRYRRILGYDYWDEELPTFSEMNEALDNLAKVNNQVDYIITHTCPLQIANEMTSKIGTEDMYLLKFFDEIFESVKFKHWYFGHWHMYIHIRDNVTAMYRDIERIE